MGTTKEKKASVTKGWIFMSLWAILILSGIVAKRGFSHPDLVVFFHVPAAVFLVLAWRELSYEVRKRYRAVIDGEKGTSPLLTTRTYQSKKVWRYLIQKD